MEAVMCGYGDRAGNCPLEEVAMGLEVLMGVKTGIDMSRLTYTAELVQELTKMPLAQNKPIIGTAQYTIYSGLSVDIFDVLKQKLGKTNGLYAWEPELVGHPPMSILMGKMSGAGSVKHKLQEWGIQAEKDQLKAISKKIKDESILRKWSLTDDQVKAIAKEVLGDE